MAPGFLHTDVRIAGTARDAALVDCFVGGSAAGAVAVGRGGAFAAQVAITEPGVYPVLCSARADLHAPSTGPLLLAEALDVPLRGTPFWFAFVIALVLLASGVTLIAATKRTLQRAPPADSLLDLLHFAAVFCGLGALFLPLLALTTGWLPVTLVLVLAGGALGWPELVGLATARAGSGLLPAARRALGRRGALAIGLAAIAPLALFAGLALRLLSDSLAPPIVLLLLLTLPLVLFLGLFHGLSAPDPRRSVETALVATCATSAMLALTLRMAPGSPIERWLRAAPATLRIAAAGYALVAGLAPLELLRRPRGLVGATIVAAAVIAALAGAGHAPPLLTSSPVGPLRPALLAQRSQGAGALSAIALLAGCGALTGVRALIVALPDRRSGGAPSSRALGGALLAALVVALVVTLGRAAFGRPLIAHSLGQETGQAFATLWARLSPAAAAGTVGRLAAALIAMTSLCALEALIATSAELGRVALAARTERLSGWGAGALTAIVALLLAGTCDAARLARLAAIADLPLALLLVATALRMTRPERAPLRAPSL